MIQNEFVLSWEKHSQKKSEIERIIDIEYGRNLPERISGVIHTLSKLTQLIALVVMPGKQ